MRMVPKGGPVVEGSESSVLAGPSFRAHPMKAPGQYSAKSNVELVTELFRSDELLAPATCDPVGKEVAGGDDPSYGRCAFGFVYAHHADIG
jgi:hypothetical protein